MKAVTFKLNTVLAGVVGAVCLVLLLVRTFMPQAILPLIDIPNLAAVCAAALVIECYLGRKQVPKRNWALTAVLAFLTFWLLPWRRACAPAWARRCVWVSLPGCCLRRWPSSSPPSGSV